MSEEDQQKVLMSRLNTERQIIKEMDRRRLVIAVLPDVLDEGSTVYIASLSVLGGHVYKIRSIVEKFRKKNIAIISLKENVNTLLESDWIKFMCAWADIETDGTYPNTEKRNTKHHGGRQKKEMTPEMLKVISRYECGLITYKEALKEIGVCGTTFYRIIRENRKQVSDGKSEELLVKAKEVHEMLKDMDDEPEVRKEGV